MGPLTFTHVWDFVRYCDEHFPTRTVIQDPFEASERARAVRKDYGPYPGIGLPITWKGESRTLGEWAALWGITRKALAGRVQRNGVEAAMQKTEEEVTGLRARRASLRRKADRSQDTGLPGTTA